MRLDYSAHISGLYRWLLIVGITCALLTGIVVIAQSAGRYMNEEAVLFETVLHMAYIGAIAMAFTSCLWASRHSVSYKKLWRWMTTGTLFWLLGATSLLYYVLAPGNEKVPSPSIADIFFVAYLPIILGVLFSLGRMRPPYDVEKKLLISNTTMATLAMFLICYEFILLPAWYGSPTMSTFDKLFTIAYPLVDWLIMSIILFASHRLLENRFEGWVVLLISAAVVSVAADIPTYILGTQINVFTIMLMLVTAIMIAASAFDEVTGAIIGTKEKQPNNDKRELYSSVVNMNPWYTTFAPLVAAMVIPIAWLNHSRSDLTGGGIVLFAVSTLIILTILIRNHRLSLDNVMLFAKSLQDQLTGLNNHRYFQEALDRAVSRADKVDDMLSLVLMDIDDFSNINNRFGHMYGDNILSDLGVAIKGVTREEDEACRLSSDEFGIILPNMRPVEAKLYAESLQKHIYEFFKEKRIETEITLSIGISAYPTLAKDKNELLVHVESALYWAKTSGKNRTVLYNKEQVKILNPEERARRAEEAALVDIVAALASAVDARDPYTRLHSKGVSIHARRLAEAVGLSAEDVKYIEIAGILHDVGKIGIPDSILNKPGQLSEAELLVVKNHPIISAQIIESTSLKNIVSIVRAHHERWDGQGYPDGLRAESIPREARILAVADSFDAMTTDRPYRKAMLVEDALREINRCSGTQFDPDLAKAFVAVYSSKRKPALIQETPSSKVEAG